MNTLKVLTLNLWGEQPPLDERMVLAASRMLALKPDVVALQEVRAIPGQLENQAHTFARALDMQAHYAVATPWGGGEEGLALLSRFPMVDLAHRELPHAQDKERRIVLGAALQTPCGAAHVFTTHLNYRLADGQKRAEQVAALEAFVAEQKSELPKIVMGDFNAIPDSDEIRYLRGLHSGVDGKRVFYQDAYAVRHPGDPGFTWARRNPYTERLRWLERDRRIDYIFVTPMTREGRGLVQDCRIVLDEPDARGVYASDHFGLFAEVQLTPIP